MSHNTIKPRNKMLHDILATRKCGPHEAKNGKNMKRSRLKKMIDREINKGLYE